MGWIADDSGHGKKVSWVYGSAGMGKRTLNAIHLTYCGMYKSTEDINSVNGIEGYQTVYGIGKALWQYKS